MEIALIILVLILIALVITLLVRPAKVKLDTSRIEERLIRVEGELDKLSPKIETQFRENRQEISQNF